MTPPVRFLLETITLIATLACCSFKGFVCLPSSGRLFFLILLFHCAHVVTLVNINLCSKLWGILVCFDRQLVRNVVGCDAWPASRDTANIKIALHYCSEKKHCFMTSLVIEGKYWASSIRGPNMTCGGDFKVCCLTNWEHIYLLSKDIQTASTSVCCTHVVTSQLTTPEYNLSTMSRPGSRSGCNNIDKPQQSFTAGGRRRQRRRSRHTGYDVISWLSRKHNKPWAKVKGRFSYLLKVLEGTGMSGKRKKKNTWLNANRFTQ